MGDNKCDAAIEAIFEEYSSSVGRDLLQSLLEHAEKHPERDAATAFLHEISQAPPPDICLHSQDVELARPFFLDHAVQITQALLHYSLAAGFARLGLNRS
jgi:hypothetical protein